MKWIIKFVAWLFWWFSEFVVAVNSGRWCK